MRILTLDVGGTAIKSAIMDESGALLEQRTTPSGGATAMDLARLAARVAQDYRGFDVLSVAMTGQIDDRAQTLLFEYNKPVPGIGHEVGKLFREAVGKPVFILNDSTAAALGEARFGAGQAYSNFLCLTYGTGVGGGLIQNGTVFTGRRGIAGEVGHMVTHTGGRLCGCGHRGCYERYASTTALLQAARKYRPELENARQLFDAAPDDPALRRVIRGWIREIVEGLCTLTYIFSPDCIILGGGVMEREDVLAEVRRQYAKRLIPTFGTTEILPARLGNTAGMFGAAAYAMDRLKEET